MTTSVRTVFSHYEPNNTLSSLQRKNNNNSGPGITQIDSLAPFFERIGDQDFAEIQNCHAIIESLQQRVQHLEHININLEHRLEKEAKANIQLEKDALIAESNWRMKCEAMEKEIQVLTSNFENEKMKNDRLLNRLTNAEKEMYTILQRKHELIRGGGGQWSRGPVTHATQSNRDPSSAAWGTAMVDPDPSIDNIYGTGTQQVRQPKDIRPKKLLSNLAEFFGV